MGRTGVRGVSAGGCLRDGAEGRRAQVSAGLWHPLGGGGAATGSAGGPTREGTVMAKGQRKSNKEIRKPKAEKPPKANASNPSTKDKPVGIATLKS